MIESAGLDDADIKTNNKKIETSLVKAGKAVDVSSKEILTEHNKRGFYMLTDSKLKGTVEFPSFEGMRGENVYEFVTKFRRAIVSNQLAERDKVPKLIKCLSGEAKKKIGLHYSDVNVALKDLESYFGNPHVIWQVCVEEMKKVECTTSNVSSLWGKYG